LLYFNKIWIFSADFHNIPQYQISWQTVQWESRKYRRTHGWAGQTKLQGAFNDYANAPINNSGRSQRGIMVYFKPCIFVSWPISEKKKKFYKYSLKPQAM
jgi:hypothetical protein